MPKATLLYLHGVTSGDADDVWRSALDDSLQRLGHPSLSTIDVIAPLYIDELNGVDSEHRLPDITIPGLDDDTADRRRREFERRRTSIEILLGADEPHDGLPASDLLATVAVKSRGLAQARRYANEPNVRAAVLHRVLSALPTSGRLMIVGHSLGSVVAADLLRRLDPEIEVAGMVTIGSPLAHQPFDLEGLRDSLREPPTNLAWWANLWTPLDPVAADRGASAAAPWVVDRRITPSPDRWRAALKERDLFYLHKAAVYLADDCVATAIGRGLFGSQSKEIVQVVGPSEMALSPTEASVVIALRHAHLTLSHLDGDTKERFGEALRSVQAETFRQLVGQIDRDHRKIPPAVAELRVDLEDPLSPVRMPPAPVHLSTTELLVPLINIITTNTLSPFEIEVPERARTTALEQLTLDLEVGTWLARNVLGAIDEVREALDGPTNWFKWTALGVGAVALIGATGGMALAAAPGVAGAAAVTSALATFGPGGMVGGLLTAGTLITAGGGGIALGLAAPMASAASLEAVVATQLVAALARQKHGLRQESYTWDILTELERAVARELARVEPVSDKSASHVKELHHKRLAISRAIELLETKGLALQQEDDAPEPMSWPMPQPSSPQYFSLPQGAEHAPTTPQEDTP